MYGWLYRGFDKIFCQSPAHLTAFEKIGVKKEKLRVSGNIKHEKGLEIWESERIQKFKEKFGWKKEFVITAASTHSGEEELILKAFEKLKLNEKSVVLALVPRHPERGKEVLELARRLYFKAQRLTYYNQIFRPLSVLVVDVMGVLPDFYQIADIVILGGTFAEIGGHNIFEPASLKKAIIVGPHTDSISEEVELLKQNSGLLQIQSDAEALYFALEKLFHDESERKRFGEQAYSTLAKKTSPAESIVSEISAEIGGD